jgi:hypothetical protein
MNADTPPEQTTPPLVATCSRSRRIGLFLMAAMFVVSLLGVQVVQAWDNPRRVALYLAIYFIFFAAVIFRALLECMDIMRERVTAQQQLFRGTLGDGAFNQLLGRRVSQHKAD